MIRFEYKNYRGEVSNRTVIPQAICYKTSEYHGLGWLLIAHDVDKNQVREFSLKDINPATVVLESWDNDLIRVFVTQLCQVQGWGWYDDILKGNFTLRDVKR